jgi:hypothetical protein
LVIFKVRSIFDNSWQFSNYECDCL